MKKKKFLDVIFLVIIFFPSLSKAGPVNTLMNKLNIIVNSEPVSKSQVETALNIKLPKNDKSSNPEIKIYQSEDAFITRFNNYSKVELRSFNNDSKFILIIDLKDPFLLNLEELKTQFTYKNFTVADEVRHEPKGYHFEKKGKKISFYLDSTTKYVTMVRIDGNFKK